MKLLLFLYVSFMFFNFSVKWLALWLVDKTQHLSVCQECFWVSGKFKDEAR